MAVDSGPGPVSDGGGRDGALRALVAAAVDRGLALPAMLLLEAALPLHLLAQQACYIAHPLLRPWVGNRLLAYADLLGDAGALERALEQLSALRFRRRGSRPG